jgi:hypothetical protein
LFHGRVCAPFFRSLPLAATLAAGSASAQPVIDEFVSGAHVNATKECALLKVNFHVRVRYAGHFPLDQGDELRISLKVIEPEFNKRLRMVKREGVRVDRADLAGVQAVTLDLDQIGGPALRVQFTHPRAYQVVQFGNFDSIAVMIPKAGSLKKCKLSDFGISAALQSDQPAGGAADASMRTRESAGGKIPLADAKAIEAWMDEARAALKKNKFSEAIALWKKVLQLPQNLYSAEAQEMIGVALQKAGQTEAARAAFEDYLRRHPQGEGSERVTQRLNALLTASGESPEKLSQSSPKIPKKMDAGDAERKDETQWSVSGSASSFYIRDDTFNTAKDISLAPNPNADPDAHRTHQDTFLTNFDLYGSIVSEQVKTKFKIAATDEHRFGLNGPDVDRYGISTAFIESTLKESDVTLRVGRQTRNNGGVLGRFDGGVLSWKATDSIQLNAVAGSPNWSRFDAPFKDGKLLFGASVDFARVIDGLDTTIYAIEQDDKWFVDRRAIGAEFRYFAKDKAAFGTIDYDIHFQRLNAAIFSGSWTFEDKSVLAGAVDYRRVPYLSSWNALQGQPFFTLYDMLKFNTRDEIRRFAIDRTPTFESAMGSYSRPLNDNFQVGVDATVTRLSGTAPSGGVDGTRPSGTEYYVSTQLIGTNLFTQGDMFIGAFRYASLSDSKVYFLDLNTRYPLTDDLRISPRLRVGYRNGTTTNLKETTVLPSLLLNYSLTKDLGLEAEIGYKWMRSYQDTIRSKTSDIYLTVGLRSDFSTEGMYRCAGILAPCIGNMLFGPPRMDKRQLAHEQAHYGNPLFDKTIPEVTSAFAVEGGFRYWYSRGKNNYDYFADQTASLLVSRLSYTNLTANSGEFFFRADARHGLIRNFFLKGYIGGGGVSGGRLSDEDLPPVVDPYSRTISSAAGNLRYGSIDLGYNVYADERIRLGAFVGFHSWFESADARGCSQIGGNPFICGSSLPSFVKVVSEKDRWNSLRVGTVIDVNLTDRLKWNGEIALISTSQRLQDTHYFTFGADPAKGHGGGFQAETILKYQFTDNLSVGIGARWWHVKTHAIDQFGQLLKYRTDRYGLFVQASYRFNLGLFPIESREGL